jgi:hypothetical protein
MFANFLLESVVFIAIGLLVGYALWRWAIGNRQDATPEQMAEINARPKVQTVAPTGSALPATPIQLKLASAPVRNSAYWAIGFAFGSLSLFGDPSLLWGRWLAWPVAGVMLLLAFLGGVFTWSDWRSRLVASATGVELHSGFSVDKRVRWEQVGAVRLIEHWADTELSRCSLLLLDKQGETLLDIDEPLRPPETYRTFLDAIPVWSGVPVVREKRVNGVAVAMP